VLLNRGLVGLQRQFGRFGKEKNFVLTRIRTWLFGCWFVDWLVGQLVVWLIGGLLGLGGLRSVGTLCRTEKFLLL